LAGSEADDIVDSSELQAVVQEAPEVLDFSEPIESAEDSDSQASLGAQQIQIDSEEAEMSEAVKFSEPQELSEAIEISEVPVDQELPIASEIRLEHERPEFPSVTEVSETAKLIEAAEGFEFQNDQELPASQNIQVEPDVQDLSDAMEIHEFIEVQDSPIAEIVIPDPEVSEYVRVKDAVADQVTSNEISIAAATTADVSEDDSTVEGDPESVFDDSTVVVSEEIDFSDFDLQVVDVDLFAPDDDSIKAETEPAEQSSDVDVSLDDTPGEVHPSDEGVVDHGFDEQTEVKVGEQYLANVTGSEVEVITPDSSLRVVDQDDIVEALEPTIPTVEETAPKGFIKRWATRIVSWVKRFVGF